MSISAIARHDAFIEAAEMCEAFFEILGNQKNIAYLNGAQDCAQLLAGNLRKMAERK